jgi:hypothetical protein
MRMLVVTPQFAAGAGMVIAAILAVDLPHAALSYGPNPEVRTCSARDCVTTKPGTGGLTTTDPGIKLREPRHSPGASEAALPDGSASPAHSSSAQPAMHYHTIRHVDSGFIGMITITTHPAQGGWSLGFGFPGARIQHIWGATWHAGGDTGGVVVTGKPWPWPGQKSVTSRIVVFATGTASAPGSCTFDGAACTFR